MWGHNKVGRVVLISLLLLMLVSPAVLAPTAGAEPTFSIYSDFREIQEGEPFNYFLDSGGNPVTIVIDKDDDGNFSVGDLNVTASGGGEERTFPGEKTSGLNGTFDVHAIDKTDLTEGEDLGAADDQVTVDGITPYITDLDLTNPTDQTLNISFNSTETLANATVELSDSSTTVKTFSEENLDTRTVDGSYRYNTTYAAGSDDTYTVEITEAEDSVGNDAAINQTGELTDSVTVETTPVEIASIEAEVGNETVVVTFNESVVNTNNAGLVPGNLTYTDVSSDGAGTIVTVDHDAESATATVMLDDTVSRTGLGNDTIAPASGEITDTFGNPALTDAVDLTDTIDPTPPTDATAGPINATTEAEYTLTVDLEADHEAGTLTVDLTNGTTVTASQYVDAEEPTPIEFGPLDVSGLDEGTVTVDATLTDDGGNDATNTSIATVTKDTNPPDVVSASITNATIGTADAGVKQTVTVEFNETMDTSVDPNVTIENLTRSYEVKNESFTGTTWTGTVTIVDDNEQANAEINVSEAADELGNVMSFNRSSTFEVDTRGPADPESTTAKNISLAEGNEGDYTVTVGIVDESNVDKVEVRLEDENGDTVRKNVTPVDSTTVTVSGIDTTSLVDGEITVTASAFTGGFDNSGGFTAETTVTKDTGRPAVTEVSIVDLIDDDEAEQNQQVTITFNESLNRSVDLNVTVEGLNRSYDLDGSFDTDTTWRDTFVIEDDDEEATATVSIDNGTDQLGNVMTENTSTTVAVDTVTPTITDFNLSHAGDRRINVSFNASQPLSTVDVQFTTSPENPTLALGDFTNESVGGVEVYTATETVGSDGNYTADLQTAADSAGNDGSGGETDSTTVDTTPPTFGGFDPAVGSITADNEPTIDLTISDLTTSVDNETIDVTVANAEGTIVGNATDSDPGVDYTGTNLSLDPATLDGGITFADGDLKVTVIANDTEGNENATSYNLTVDTTAPTVSLAEPDGDELFNDSESAIINWMATDAEGVATIRIENSTDGSTWTEITGGTANDGEYSWDVPTLDSETVQIRVNATDTAGNVGSNTSATFEVDSTPPTISDFIAANPTDRTLTVSFNASEQLGAVAVGVPNASTTLALGEFTETDYGGTYGYNETITVGSDGVYEPSLDTAADLAGNDGAGGESDSVTVDTTPPALSNLSVGNPTGQELSIGFDTNESVGSAEINVTGPVNETLAIGDFDETAYNNGTFSYDRTTTSNDGDYTVTAVRVVDAAGNDGADNESVTASIDTTAPTISNVSVTNPTGRQVRLAFESSESVASATVEISGVENATVMVSDPAPVGGVYEIEYAAGIDGSYTATLTAATDSAGNDGADDENGTVAVSVDDPVISNTGVSNPSGQTVDIGFDSSTVLSTINVSISGPESATLDESNFTQSGSRYTASYDAGTDGTYTANLTKAVDDNGDNETDIELGSVSVDTSGGGGGGGGGGGNGGGGGGGGGSTASSGSSSDPPTTVTVTEDESGSTNVTVENPTPERVDVPLGNNTETESLTLRSLALSSQVRSDYTLSVAVDADGFDDTPDFAGRAVGFTRVDHGSADDSVNGDAEDADDSEVAAATFEFTVSADRLDEIQVDADDATVYRYHDGRWNALDTELVDQDEQSYQLRAETPGFSQFAVGLREADLLSVDGASATRSSADIGAPVSVSATVGNDGRWTATRSVALLADNATVDTVDVTVDAGESETITLETSFADSGVYELRVGSTAAGTVVVGDVASTAASESTEEPTDQQPTVEESGSDEPGGGAPPLIGLVVGLLIGSLLVAGLVYWNTSESE